MIKLRVLLACTALTLGASAMPASADSIPGLRGHDHTGITVPDVKAATAFFTDVIGCKHAMSFGPFRDDKGTFMQDVLNVNKGSRTYRPIPVRAPTTSSRPSSPRRITRAAAHAGSSRSRRRSGRRGSRCRRRPR